MIIRNRDQLISLLESNAPFPRIKRALQEGTVENLGAFKHTSGGSKPGWLVKVTSKFNKTWYIKIQPILNTWFYGTVIMPAVPWECWIGDRSDNKLYQGDNVRVYKKLRKEKRNGGKTEER